MKPSPVNDFLRAAGLRPPRVLTFATTGVCNLSCEHCWVEAGGESSLPPVPSLVVRRMVEEFADLGGEGVQFTGGEPLCHPDWLEFLQFTRDLGLPQVGLQSNGMLFSTGAVAALRELDFPGLRLQVSLDGATAANHDRVRGAGSFAAVVAGLRRLAAAGLASRVVIAFTEMRHNLAEFPALLELGAGLGVRAVQAGTLIAGGRAVSAEAIQPPDSPQYLALLRRFEAEERFRTLYARLGNMAAIEWWRNPDSNSGCCRLVESPYLTPAGVLYPCNLCHIDGYAVSGVFKKGLAAAFGEGAELWSQLLQLRNRRVESIPACTSCPEQTLCAGGCVGRAWGSCGDLLAVDDRCEVRRTVAGHRLSGAENN